MEKVVLANKPLIEAIFEIRWALKEQAPGLQIDPYFKLLLGSIYERIKGEYPFHEELPTVTMPDFISGYIVQHRFRKESNGWPLIQLGPGIMTLNDTQKYNWDDFERRIDAILTVLFDLYKDIKITNIILRYIDGIPFDFEGNNIFAFLEDKLKTEIKLPTVLFEDREIKPLPQNIDLLFSFYSSRPSGLAQLRFLRGNSRGTESLIWETIVQSVASGLPGIKADISTWLNQAHDLTDDWFFELIDGDLRRSFQ